MPTPQPTPANPADPVADGTRVPLRLALSDHAGSHPGTDALDGGWWPQSRDLSVELADLVAHFPAASGRIVRALFSPPDWDGSPRRVPVPGGSVKVGSFPRDDTHVVVLRTADRTVLRLLVVPATQADGAEALTAAAG